MRYLKILLFNFFAVFFVDYLVPGIDIVDQTKIPHIGGDLIFAASLGFCNSLAFPVLRLVKRSAGGVHLAIFLLVVNFVAYGLLKFFALGVFVTSFQGYFMAASSAFALSFFLNYPWGKKPREETPPVEEEPYHAPHEEE